MQSDHFKPKCPFKRKLLFLQSTGQVVDVSDYVCRIAISYCFSGFPCFLCCCPCWHTMLLPNCTSLYSPLVVGPHEVTAGCVISSHVTLAYTSGVFLSWPLEHGCLHHSSSACCPSMAGRHTAYAQVCILYNRTSLYNPAIQTVQAVSPCTCLSPGLACLRPSGAHAPHHHSHSATKRGQIC